MAASERGAGHERSGVPCQDAHAALVLPAGFLVLAVADGAGSASLAEVAAPMACARALETLGETLQASAPNEDAGWHEVLRMALARARAALESESAGRQVALRELACTLIVVVAGAELVAGAQVGDGASVYALAGAGGAPDEIKALTTPDSGEHINETTFLVSDGAVEGAQVAIARGQPARVALLTDGLQMLALEYPSQRPFARFFDPLFRFVASADPADPDKANRDLRTFLCSPRVRDRTDDDVTLVLAARDT